MIEAGEIINKTPTIFFCSKIIHLNEQNIWFRGTIYFESTQMIYLIMMIL